MNAAPLLSAAFGESREALLDRVLVTAFLEHVPDQVYFKDRDSRFIAVSHSLARACGYASPHELIGRADSDFFVAEHAQWTRVDEENIMSTGEPIIGKLTKDTWADGHISWSLTSKLPLRDESGEIIGTFGISQDVSAQKSVELDLERTNQKLIDTSRMAGMAEVATSVLHNVGNVLNSLNVSASMLATGMRQSKAESLAKLASLLADHRDDLAEFLTLDPKGRRVPEFLASLAQHAISERTRLLQEIASLQKNVDHIKEIVTMQQAYATMAGMTEALDPVELMEDSLRMNAGSLVRHEIRLIRDFQPVPSVLGERGKIIQILVNLIRNAKYADDEGGSAEKTITVRLAPGAPGRVQFAVSDTGIGIPPENLERIFVHGFTTRAHGHGFGLHSSAGAAKEMKGTLSVHSAGLGLGATFTLDLPAIPRADAA